MTPAHFSSFSAGHYIWENNSGVRNSERDGVQNAAALTWCMLSTAIARRIGCYLIRARGEKPQNP